jgi:hypothetical protein
VTPKYSGQNPGETEEQFFARMRASQVQAGQITQEQSDEAARLQRIHRKSGAPASMAYTQEMRAQAEREAQAAAARTQRNATTRTEQSVARETAQAPPPPPAAPKPTFRAPAYTPPPRRAPRQSRLAPLSTMFAPPQPTPQAYARPALVTQPGTFPTWLKVTLGVVVVGAVVVGAVSYMRRREG